MQYIKEGVRKLESPDGPLHVSLSGPKCSLIVFRDGDPVSLVISKKVAEELIAAGASYDG